MSDRGHEQVAGPEPERSQIKPNHGCEETVSTRDTMKGAEKRAGHNQSRDRSGPATDQALPDQTEEELLSDACQGRDGRKLPDRPLLENRPDGILKEKCDLSRPGRVRVEHPEQDRNEREYRGQSPEACPGTPSEGRSPGKMEQPGK